MNSALSDRCSRFRQSFDVPSAVADEVEQGVGLNEDIRDMVYFTESLYPRGFDGQSVLGRDLDPIAADETVGQCEPLMSLADRIDGRRSPDSAVWISRSGRQPAASSQLFTGAFRESWAGKPEGALFTSDAGSFDLGMWYVYGLTKSEFYQPPCRAWRLVTDSRARVLNIATAEDWCRTTALFPRPVRGTDHCYEMDWAMIAQGFDAVNLTLRAVAAIDCFGFKFEGINIAPSFWSVQTTVWLRWVFDRHEEVRVEV